MANLFTRASAAIDRGVVRFMERRMSPRTPKLDPSEARQKLIEMAALYNADTLGTPSRFFPAPPVPRMELVPAGEGPLGTHVVDLRWDSEYTPFAAPGRDMHFRATENLTAHARWWTNSRSTSAGRPTIVLLHGWGGGSQYGTTNARAVTQ